MDSVRDLALAYVIVTDWNHIKLTPELEESIISLMPEGNSMVASRLDNKLLAIINIGRRQTSNYSPTFKVMNGFFVQE